jgi:retinol dehydrogenase-14
MNALMGVHPQVGAQTIIYLASSPQVEGLTGKYFNRGKEVRSSDASYDREAAARFWQISAEMTGLS